MLILSRRTSESIIVGDEVTITVLSVKGKQVRIGIDAPPHIGVHREEIYDRIKAEGEAGTKNSSSAGESDSADSTDVATGNQADSDADDDDNLGNV